jgi:hypothetical protein
MLYRDIVAVCSQIHKKYINTLLWQNVELMNVEMAVHIVTIKQQQKLPIPSQTAQSALPVEGLDTNRLQWVGQRYSNMENKWLEECI